MSHTPTSYNNLTVIKHYQIQQKVGSGEFGVVYKCLDQTNKEIVAIKHIAKQLKTKNNRAYQLFLGEIEILKSLNCPNVVKYLDNFEDENGIFLVEEFCSGGTLQDLMNKQQNSRFSESQAILYMQQMVLGLLSLHQQKSMHRDLKLDNILVSEDSGLIKIADLGFAKYLGDSSSTRTCLGTQVTKAPEIMEAKSYGIEVDMYSLGIIFYQMIIGEYPYDECSDMKMLEVIKANNAQFKHKKQGPVKISQEISMLIKSMIQYDPGQRQKFQELYKNPYLFGNLSEQQRVAAINFYQNSQMTFESNNIQQNQMNQNNNYVGSNQNFTQQQQFQSNYQQMSQTQQQQFLVNQQQMPQNQYQQYQSNYQPQTVPYNQLQSPNQGNQQQQTNFYYNQQQQQQQQQQPQQQQFSFQQPLQQQNQQNFQDQQNNQNYEQMMIQQVQQQNVISAQNQSQFNNYDDNDSMDGTVQVFKSSKEKKVNKQNVQANKSVNVNDPPKQADNDDPSINPVRVETKVVNRETKVVNYRNQIALKNNTGNQQVQTSEIFRNQNNKANFNINEQEIKEDIDKLNYNYTMFDNQIKMINFLNQCLDNLPKLTFQYLYVYYMQMKIKVNMYLTILSQFECQTDFCGLKYPAEAYENFRQHYDNLKYEFQYNVENNFYIFQKYIKKISEIDPEYDNLLQSEIGDICTQNSGAVYMQQATKLQNFMDSQNLEPQLAQVYQNFKLAFQQFIQPQQSQQQ